MNRLSPPAFLVNFDARNPSMLKEESGHRYIEQGEGPVLLVLHGLFRALSNFKDVLDEFSKDYKVVIPIMPIYDLPMLKINVKELAKYIHQFVNLRGMRI